MSGIEFFRGEIIRRILAGEELSCCHLQVIIAALSGEKGSLWRLWSGEEIKYDIPENIKGYKPYRKKKHPSGVSPRIKWRNIAVFKAKKHLEQQGVGYNDAVQELVKRSKELFSESLSKSVVKKAIREGEELYLLEEQRIEGLIKQTGLDKVPPNTPIPVVTTQRWDE